MSTGEPVMEIMKGFVAWVFCEAAAAVVVILVMKER